MIVEGPERRKVIPPTAEEALRELRIADAQAGLTEWELELHGFDPLTGAKTRKAFEVELETHLRSARKSSDEHRKHSTPVSVIFLDLDKFKQVNDTFGHQEGDAVLKQAVEVLKHSVRETDSIGRYGGDEFLVLLPGAHEEEAMTIAEKIRTNLKSNPLLNRYSIQGSFGVSSSDASAEGAMLIGYADLAAKEAKDSGKDRVVRYGKHVEHKV